MWSYCQTIGLLAVEGPPTPGLAIKGQPESLYLVFQVFYQLQLTKPIVLGSVHITPFKAERELGMKEELVTALLGEIEVSISCPSNTHFLTQWFPTEVAADILNTYFWVKIWVYYLHNKWLEYYTSNIVQSSSVNRATMLEIVQGLGAITDFFKIFALPLTPVSFFHCHWLQAFWWIWHSGLTR